MTIKYTPLNFVNVKVVKCPFNYCVGVIRNIKFYYLFFLQLEKVDLYTTTQKAYNICDLTFDLNAT